MQKHHKPIIGQFLTGLAIATIAGTIITPLGTQTFSPGLAMSGIIAASIFLLIAAVTNRMPSKRPGGE
ncbi:hypothetical protein [Devosia sp. LjRoot3]|uniref:hypothetical protein n=1 Tax=Devosia sp. LjRoot3 TaxID=3342319 RepID=UPI003ECEE692